MNYLRASLVGLIILSGHAANAQHMHHAAAACDDTKIACATAATPAFGPDGSLWLAWSAGGHVMVARSKNLGQSFAPAVTVNPQSAEIDGGPDARPKILVDARNGVHIAYAIFQGEAYNGRVRVSRSNDAGASFSAPQPISDDGASERFENIAFDPSGDLFAAWLDKRNLKPARARGEGYEGAGLAFSWSNDGGSHFANARIAADNSCECCRIGVAFAGPHRPVVVFRNIYDHHTRDHAVLSFEDANTPGLPFRVSVDDWKVDACPHQGPALAISSAGSYHTAWFTQGSVRQGLFYARSSDGGAHFSDPMAVGSPERRAERPSLLARDRHVWLVWKEFDGENTAVKLRESADDGATWSPERPVATTADASDHPLLIADGKRTYLSWLTRSEGYRLIAVDAGS